jgi:hypothetical protein
LHRVDEQVLLQRGQLAIDGDLLLPVEDLGGGGEDLRDPRWCGLVMAALPIGRITDDQDIGVEEGVRRVDADSHIRDIAAAGATAERFAKFRRDIERDCNMPIRYPAHRGDVPGQEFVLARLGRLPGQERLAGQNGTGCLAHGRLARCSTQES